MLRVYPAMIRNAAAQTRCGFCKCYAMKQYTIRIRWLGGRTRKESYEIRRYGQFVNQVTGNEVMSPDYANPCLATQELGDMYLLRVP